MEINKFVKFTVNELGNKKSVGIGFVIGKTDDYGLDSSLAICQDSIVLLDSKGTYVNDWSLTECTIMFSKSPEIIPDKTIRDKTRLITGLDKDHFENALELATELVTNLNNSLELQTTIDSQFEALSDHSGD